jgi:energy-coupling factor transporter transmembrane protein EcfT
LRERQNLARLRRGAVGAYRELDTPIHRLSPLEKYLVTLLGCVASLAIRGWLGLTVWIALEFAPLLLARYPLKRLAWGILKILPWLVGLGALQYALTPGDLAPFLFILRFIALYIPLSLFMFVTSHTEIMYGMEDLLRPLAPLGVPIRDVSLVAGIVFRFMDNLYAEASRITIARIVRGAGQRRQRGLIAAVSSMASLFVPLILRTLSRAELLAQAISARYYGSGKNSRYLQWRGGVGRLILVISVAGLTAAAIFLSRFFGI